MKKRLTIIIIAFCLSFAAMVALSLYSMERFALFSNYSSQVDHSSEVIMNIRSAEVSLRDIGLTERGYMITKDADYLQLLNDAIDSINKRVAEIKDMTIDNREQQKNVSLLRGTIALLIAAARENIAYIDTAHLSISSKFYDDSRQLMMECSRRLSDMRIVENKLLFERFNSERFYQKLTNETLKYLLIIFCLITLILFGVMIKELRSRMLFQEELQAKVIDLKRSHSELQEIAYVASHDLQEPLRKIHVFSNMLLLRKADSMDKDYKETLSRINNFADRMQILITDLMSLTNLANTDEHKTPVDLNRIMQTIMIEMNEKIKEKEAAIEFQSLPIIDGYDSQLKILFSALLDNSLKFTREGVKPVITISAEIMNGYELSDVNPNLLHKEFYRITCSDNGIGFDNKFINKIFRIFQRLHTPDSEYEGKGIGLAICQRIMANHEGYLTAYGAPNMGAQFKLFFPT